MNVLEPARLLRVYDEGKITRHDLLHRLIVSAACYESATTATLLTPAVLQQLRELSQEPPSSLEEAAAGTIFIRSWCGPWDAQIAAQERQRQRQELQLWYEGVHNWYRFFQPA